MTTEAFGSAPHGEAVERHTLERDGVRLRVLTYRAIVQALDVPGADGTPADVVLGFAGLGGYLAHNNPARTSAPWWAVWPTASPAVASSSTAGSTSSPATTAPTPSTVASRASTGTSGPWPRARSTG